MKTSNELRELLKKIDHRPYPAYKDTKGKYQFKDFILDIRHIQSDPFASPSDVSVIVKNTFPADFYDTLAKKTALEDFLIRLFGQEIRSGKKAGSGKSGKVSISRPGQQILARTACRIDPEQITLRFHVGFPAQGRKIDVRGLVDIFYQQLPQAVNDTLFYNRYDQDLKDQAFKAVDLAIKQTMIRDYLKANHLTAFVADGAILPRISGEKDTPMAGAIPFQSPDSLRVQIDLNDGTTVSGMGIPEGITLIVGGGYHGKSTLLDAIQQGIYNHIAGDGREFVISDDTAFKIRAEDGRSVSGTDISLFIQNLPQKKDTVNFTSADASGSTSQAANVVEAIESGSKVLLMDEDTCATNFMVRDALMQQVVASDQEPIIPFVEQIENLKEQGISTILVAGSSGSFFEPADLIIQMDQYEPLNITADAKTKLAAYKKEYPGALQIPQREAKMPANTRIVQPLELLNQDRIKIKTTGLDTISLNRQDLDVRYLEQLSDREQLETLAKMIVELFKNKDYQNLSLAQASARLIEKMQNESLDYLSKKDLAQVRQQDLMAAVNRIRGLKIKSE